jgi:hypothetical protein
MAEEKPILRCDNILVSTRGIAETVGKKVVIFVPSEEVERITLHFGRSDYRPIVSISIGIVLTLVGVFGLVEFFAAPRGYRYELAIVAFGLIGCSLIFDALKKRYFLKCLKKKALADWCFQSMSRKMTSKNFAKKSGHFINMT